ncbi:MAG: Tat pathway signal sequence domain protein [Minwuia sp.]|uniref:Tat pathway signal sequence domain protein n=1 Tax=Minwuia sp. TaxID=2493630 RepID=UPI003A8BE944
MRSLLAVLTVLAIAGWVEGATAQEGRVALELNKLEQQGDSCRAYVLLQNGSQQDFSSLRLDLVMFDGEGIVAQRLALETAPLPPAKTSLKVFDIAGLACASIGRILLNDVLACDSAAGAVEDCLGLIDVSARGELSLIK